MSRYSDNYDDLLKIAAKWVNHYETLGVPQNASVDQIKSQYRMLIQQFHPDRLQAFPDWAKREAEETAKVINIAYQTLSDPAKRKEYDATLAGDPRPSTRQPQTKNPDVWDGKGGLSGLRQFWFDKEFRASNTSPTCHDPASKLATQLSSRRPQRLGKGSNEPHR